MYEGQPVIPVVQKYFVGLLRNFEAYAQQRARQASAQPGLVPAAVNPMSTIPMTPTTDTPVDVPQQPPSDPAVRAISGADGGHESDSEGRKRKMRETEEADGKRARMKTGPDSGEVRSVEFSSFCFSILTFCLAYRWYKQTQDHLRSPRCGIEYSWWA